MKGAILAIVLLLLFAIASRMSYEDELIMQETYCRNVLDGTWPAYANIPCEEYFDAEELREDSHH
jgi:hypothetical protein